MEAVVFATARCGSTLRTRLNQVERRRHGPAATILSVLIGLIVLLSYHSDVRGQAGGTPGASGDTGSRPRTILARDSFGPPRPGARNGSASPARGSETPPAGAPKSVSKPDSTPDAPRPEEKRFKVRDDFGRLVVARLHGQYRDKTAVVLPDGQLGFTSMPVSTPEPFRPMSADELAPLLQQGPFAKYLLLQTEHYLIFYQSSLAFAQDSGRLLEDVYRGLIDAFTRNGIPVHQSEFPLVAVIYATDRDFHAEKKLEPQVRAYYEFFTNRIFFFQRSERDQIEPEKAAMLKPQTVAHEGVHQILCNIGVQPRLSPWPLWLVEGMAEYCGTTATKPTKKGVIWKGLGAINRLNMATIAELNDSISMQMSSGDFAAIPVSRRRSTSRTESLVSEAHLTPTDYALAWSLTYYLARQRGAEFVKYLKHLNQLPPLAPRSPEQQLADFRKFFGDDLTKVDKKVDEFVIKLSQSKDYEPLPYYAVTFEQRLANGALKRAVCVSQSPQMILQWVEEKRAPDGDEPFWRAFPYVAHARAVSDAKQWFHGTGN
jgi:hypothetical protein